MGLRYPHIKQVYTVRTDAPEPAAKPAHKPAPGAVPAPKAPPAH
ncbi:MAG: hypothetical protein ABSA48_14410 [Terracidiphilus sp.]